MKKRIIIVVVLLLIAAGAAGGWWWWDTYGQDATPEDTLGGSGTVEARELAISSLIAGRITSADAKEGSEVTSGTVLFTLDTELLQLQVTQADAGVSAAQAALDQAISDEAGDAEVARAKARLDQAMAVKQIADAQLGYATITSPMAATVTKVTAALGETASPGKTLAILADLSTLYVSIYVPESQIAEITLGKEATVRTDSSESEFSGEVVFIASEAEFTPSNIETKEQRVKLVYEVRIEITDAGQLLKPGMPVDVTF